VGASLPLPAAGADRHLCANFQVKLCHVWRGWKWTDHRH
jgi:hypothetical protein